VKRVLILLMILILVVSVAACGGETTTATPVDDGAADSSVTAEPAADDSGGDGGWVEVVSMDGSTSKRSPSFTLEGGEQKLEYTIEGDTMPVMAVYVEQPDWDMDKDGGFPTAWPDEAGSDSTMLEKDAGEYIVQVESANCDWTVTILEKR
jgi:predicted small lipoprotein YifL